MTTIEQRTIVVGVFAERAQAMQSISDLRQAGFRDDELGFIVRHTQYSEHMPEPSDSAAGAATGAVGGGILGGVFGAVVALLIPGFGPAIAGGVLGATLGGAALGAATGSFIGAMTALGLSEEEAHYYQHELETGSIIVTVQASTRSQEALTLLQNAGALSASTHADADLPEMSAEDQDCEQRLPIIHAASQITDNAPLVSTMPQTSSNRLPVASRRVYSQDSVTHCDAAFDRPSRNNIPLGSGM